MAAGAGVLAVVGFPGAAWWTSGADPPATEVEPVRAAVGLVLAVVLVALAVVLLHMDREEESGDAR